MVVTCRHLVFLPTGFADASNHHFHLCGLVPGRQYYGWNIYVVNALCGAAACANKVNMVVEMMTLQTAVIAEGVSRRAIKGRYGVDDALFGKHLQRAVNGYPVYFFCCPLNIAVPEGALPLL